MLYLSPRPGPLYKMGNSLGPTSPYNSRRTRSRRQNKARAFHDPRLFPSTAGRDHRCRRRSCVLANVVSGTRASSTALLHLPGSAHSGTWPPSRTPRTPGCPAPSMLSTVCSITSTACGVWQLPAAATRACSGAAQFRVDWAKLARARPVLASAFIALARGKVCAAPTSPPRHHRLYLCLGGLLIYTGIVRARSCERCCTTARDNPLQHTCSQAKHCWSNRSQNN